LIEVIISPDDEGTHSLLMNNPVGCVYFLPLGAVSSTVRPDIVDILLFCRIRGIFLAWRLKICCRRKDEARDERFEEDLEQGRRDLNIGETFLCEIPQ
jgi:hypothetical protein